MVKSPQHRVAQWLSQLLQPVLEKYSKFCLSDSFTFAKYMRERPCNKTDFLCSFDIKSLFTCVPVQQVIDICADALFRDGLNRSRLTESNFRKLMCMSTTSVEFLFNNDVYNQKDGVAMGSPLGPTLANIFVGFYEEKLFASFPKPPTYFRYVDDTFVIFDNSCEHELFLHQLNSMHPALQFTTETEENRCPPFLDVFIEKDPISQKYLTSVYRKPTFTGDYIRFEAFCHKNRKVSLIRTLVNRAKQICSPERLQSELSQLKLIFCNNGYPAYLVNKVITSELVEKIPSNVNLPDENKTRVYMRLPFIGRPTYRFERQIKNAVRSCYESVTTHIISQSRPMFSKMRKDVLPTLSSQNVVYKFSCYCKSNYVGQTSQTLRKRLSEHVPKCLLVYREFLLKKSDEENFDEKKMTLVKNAMKRSSVCEHLANNLNCLKNFSTDMFRPIAQARSSFHLSVLNHISKQA